MKAESISDQKRLVRGLHYKLARDLLRARDAIHHGSWRFLTIAGPAPKEEIACIRELCRRAEIVSVDVSEDNLANALSAGADRVFAGDIGDLPDRGLPAFCAGKKFDVVCLDLTGPANRWLNRVITRYWRHAIAPGGAMIVTFSYGRDVVESYEVKWRQDLASKGDYGDAARRLADKLPETIAARVNFVLRLSAMDHLMSVLQYSGKEMPMVSMLLSKQRLGFYDEAMALSYEKIGDDDFALAVTAEDIGKVFACPAERIRELRRTLAAKKAVATRRSREAAQSALAV